jgi:hypothetical protein
MVKVEHTQYAPWLKDITRELQHPFVQDSERMVDFLWELKNALPREYRWQMTDIDGFRAKIDAVKHSGPEAINRVYWEDVARNLEAWAIMSTWRGIEILDSGISSLNTGRYLSSAVLGRALIEIASVMITEANNILATIEKLPQPNKDQVVMVEGLEEIILRLIWGTRQNDAPEYLTQKNILSYLKRLSKNPNASELFEVYEYLCEAAHPNVVGYTRFQCREGIRDRNDLIVHLSPDLYIGESQAGNKLLEYTLWAFGWSSVCIRNSFHIVQKSIEGIDKRFHFRKKARIFVMPRAKFGRNEPCPCGSGKKFKQCHGK